ncbi:MAG: type I methionyl aminopeptidase [Candidatus Omnitrophica bacterium]|nr:type I methionyl aminopeptidase [Candidatus Omnitrophota bacterium]
MAIYKNQQDIEKIKKACRISKAILEKVGASIKEGITTKDLEIVAEKLMKEYNTNSAFKGYMGYPGLICISVNEEVVHGIPSEKKKLKSGDIVSIDVGFRYKGFCGDCAATFPVGEISKEKNHLLEITKKSLLAGIAYALPGKRTGDVGYAIQKVVESAGFNVVKEFGGHGLGRSLHEEPGISNFGNPGTGAFIKKNMILAIEPMVNMGDSKIKILEDGWTVVTSDGLPSAHFEEDVLITENGNEVLTVYDG